MVPTASGPTAVMELTPEQIKEIKSNKSQCSSVAVAKAYLKVAAELTNLQECLNKGKHKVGVAPAQSPVALPVPLQAALNVPSSSSAASSPELRIAPFVRAAPAVNAMGPQAHKTSGDTQWSLPECTLRGVARIFDSYVQHP